MFLSLFVFPSYSQARVNAELAVVSDTGIELNNTLGWSINSAGQWVSNRNRIMYHYTYYGYTNFETLKLYDVSYNGNEYILFEIMIRTTSLEYPNITASRFEHRKSHFFIINKDDFIIRLTINNIYNNSIPLFCSFEDNNRLRRRYEPTNIYSLPNIITPKLINPVFLSRRSTRTYLEQGIHTLEIYTYYWRDENVVRFYFGDDITDTMPENFYYEASFENFARFFNPVILEDTLGE